MTIETAVILIGIGLIAAGAGALITDRVGRAVCYALTAALGMTVVLVAVAAGITVR